MRARACVCVCVCVAHREDTMDETEMMKRQMNPMANNPTFDATAAFKQEKQALSQVRHEYMLCTHSNRGPQAETHATLATVLEHGTLCVLMRAC